MTTHQRHNTNQVEEAAKKQRRTKLVGQGPVALTPQFDPSTGSGQAPLVLQRTVADPGRARPADILALQRTVGNRAVARLIQAKLMVGPAGDRYEQEADRVAEQVMSMPVPLSGERGARSGQQPVRRQAPEEEEVQTKLLAASITPLVQRQAEEEEELQTKPLVQRQAEEEEEEVQAKPLVQRQAEEEEEEVQTKPLVQRQADGSFEASPSLESRLAAQKGSDSPLPDDVRAYMEPRFGADFSGVRVHTGGEAAQLSHELNAQAFTHGQDVYMGAGKYDPGSDAGKRLLAHELTHVVQQNGNALHRNVDEKSAPQQSIQATPQKEGAILQRAIGIEFETPWMLKRGSTFAMRDKKRVQLPAEPISKGAQIVNADTGMSLTADTTPGGAEIEFQTPRPFDEDNEAGFMEAVDSMVSMGQALEAKKGNPHIHLRTLEIQGLGKLQPNFDSIFTFPDPKGMVASPQVTGGFRLDELTNMMLQIADDKTVVDVRTHRTFVGDPLLQGTLMSADNTIIAMAANRARTAQPAIKEVLRPLVENPSLNAHMAQLEGLMSLMMSYLLKGSKPDGNNRGTVLSQYELKQAISTGASLGLSKKEVQEYIKHPKAMTLAKAISPLQARTDFGGLFNSLPGPLREAIHRAIVRDPTWWSKTILQAAGLADNKIYEFGFFTDEGDWVDYPLTRSEWINGIANGNDLLTFAVTASEEHSKERVDPARPERSLLYKSMGLLKSKMDIVGPDKVGGAVLELRRMATDVPLAQWEVLCQKLFKWIKAVNDVTQERVKF